MNRRVEEELNRALAIFERDLTRVEVFLSDENSSEKFGMNDKCVMEARPRGRQPISVNDTASTTEQVVKGAAGKMKRLLESTAGKLEATR